jgi:hypothetical protein
MKNRVLLENDYLPSGNVMMSVYPAWPMRVSDTVTR